MDPISFADTILKILSIANNVIEKAKTVKANKQQCLRLAKRLQVITRPLITLSQIHDNVQFNQALENIESVIERCLTFIDQYSDKHWIKIILTSGTHKSMFEELNQDLFNSAQLLNLGINVQQIINREEDKQDEENDTKDLKTTLNHLLALQMETAEAVVDIKNILTQSTKKDERKNKNPAQDPVDPMKIYEKAMIAESEGKMEMAELLQTQAATLGYPRAICQLGVFATNKGNITMARAYFEMAVNRASEVNDAFPRGKYNLAEVLWTTRDSKEDKIRALELYKAASDAGHQEAAMKYAARNFQ